MALRRTASTLLLAALAALAALVPAHADDDEELARDALARGEILPLSEILDRVAADVRGELVGVELERADDGDDGVRLTYEIKVLSPDGDVTELYYDAATGDLLRARGHGLENHHRDGQAEETDDHAEEDESD